MAEYQMSSLIGKIVQIDRGGPESRSGIILGVGSDYLLLSTKKDGIIYYYTNHIKSITFAKNQSPIDVTQDANTPPSQPEAVMSGSMKDAFLAMKYSQIQINRGGPEHVKGLLTEIFDDYITIVHKGEVLLILYSHIKNCSFYNVDQAEAGKQENAQESAQENKDKSKDEGEKNKDKSKSESSDNKKKSSNNRQQKTRSNTKRKAR